MKKESAVKLVSKYEDKHRKPSNGFLTDYFGCKTNIFHYRHLNGLDKQVLGFPDPSDGILHEFIEYVGSCFALENSGSKFTCVELGAGNGIWCARMGVLAKRLGKRNINLIAVEADKTKSTWINDNFNDNNLNSSLFIKINKEVINKAVGFEAGFVYFPQIESPDFDYGAIPTNTDASTDYRGVKNIVNNKIEMIALNTIINDIVDLIHIDIQGGESDLVPNTIETLNKFVKVIVLGTHSRKIEGDMFSLFFKHGWNLLMENPCEFQFDTSKPTLEGMTLKDGNQVWVNPKLIDLNKIQE